MYSDPINKMYLEFLHPIVTEVNKVFESDQCNVTKLLDDLLVLYRSLLQKVMIPHRWYTWESVINFEVCCTIIIHVHLVLITGFIGGAPKANLKTDFVGILNSYIYNLIHNFNICIWLILYVINSLLITEG